MERRKLGTCQDMGKEMEENGAGGGVHCGRASAVKTGQHAARTSPESILARAERPVPIRRGSAKPSRTPDCLAWLVAYVRGSSMLCLCGDGSVSTTRRQFRLDVSGFLDTRTCFTSQLVLDATPNRSK